MNSNDLFKAKLNQPHKMNSNDIKLRKNQSIPSVFASLSCLIDFWLINRGTVNFYNLKRS